MPVGLTGVNTLVTEDPSLAARTSKEHCLLDDFDPR
jgi:hypothetical protein